MSAIENLRNRIDLIDIPYTDRGSRLLLFRRGNILSVRLAERWVKWESEVEHYRRRPGIVERFAFLDADGTHLTLQTETYPHVIQFQTSVGNFDWTLMDPETFLIRLPAGRYGFEFECYADTVQTDRRGSILRGKRHISYTTNARLIENEITPAGNGYIHVKIMLDAQAGDGFLLNITPRLGFNRSIPNPDKMINEIRSRWQAWFDAAPPVLDEYRSQYEYAWWVMRVGLLATRFYFTREAMTPSKVHYVGVWQWDQFFHALAYRHIDTHLAEDQLRIVLDHQRADGMVPDAIHDEGTITHLTAPVDADVTKPPLIAWTALKLFETSGHLDFLHEIYEPLQHWHEWWVNSCRDDNGLFQYLHPFSSGLDDSPLWDTGMPVIAPDINTYLCLQQESLAHIAGLIGEKSDVEKYRQGADDLAARMIEALWDEKSGIFNALHQGKPVPVFTLFNLLPLWTGRLPDTMVNRLITHLTDPQHFWSKWPLPTVALSDATFDPLQMWRGPTWVNINYLFIEALNRVGRTALANDLTRKTLDLMMQHSDIYEYYNPITAERPPKAAPIFGWSSAVFIDLALQQTRLAMNSSSKG